MKLRINKPMLNHKAGDVIDVPVTKHGNPSELFWRRRVRDSKLDNCVEIIKEPRPASSVSKAKPTKSKKVTEN